MPLPFDWIVWTALGFGAAMGGAAFALRRPSTQEVAGDLSRAMRVATAYAALRRHKHVRPEHLVLVSLFAQPIAGDLRTARDELLELLAREETTDAAPILSPPLVAATRRAREEAARTDRRLITLDDMLRELSTKDVYDVSPVLGRILSSAGGGAAPAPSVPPPASESSPSGPYRTATRVENVAVIATTKGGARLREASTIFTRALGVSERDAHDGAIELLMTGAAHVGSFPPDEAAKRARDAAALADELRAAIDFEAED